MFKKLLYGAAIILGCVTNSIAQTPTTVGCGISTEVVWAHALRTSITHSDGIIIPTAYPPLATDTCGRIVVYYEDVNLAMSGGPAMGFAQPAGIGLTRRSTICAMLNYVQSVWDFSNVPPNHFLRILVSRSRTASFPPDATWKGQLGYGAPYFDSTHKTGDTVNGFFYDYVKTGIDPTVDTNFHGEMVFNFDSTYRDISEYNSGKELRGDALVVPKHNGIDSVGSCEYDLYSAALHFMGHVMGWLAWGSDIHTAAKPFVSNYALSIVAGPHPDTVYNPLLSSGFVPLIGGSLVPKMFFWVNNKQAPYNHPIAESDFNHIGLAGGKYSDFYRISPGDYQDYVMQYGTVEGLMKRVYKKGDLETFHNIIGYNYTSAFASDSATIIANHQPWSSKMSYGFNSLIYKVGFIEKVSPDFAMTNNVGSSLVIHLYADTTIKDDDGDSISVYPGSVTNIRGCGNGDNNHNAISISPDGKTITYTPRANFYGRAQIGFNLFDSHEKGSYMLYTIDVAKGNNISVATGANMVQNGSMEEGEEVKIKSTAEYINNAYYFQSYYVNSRFGYHLPDGQIYPNSTAIRNSYSECGYPTTYSFGAFEQSFPFNTPTGYCKLYASGDTVINPAPYLNSGNRYITSRSGSALYYLNDTMRNCKRYLLEFDAAGTYKNTIKGLPKNDTLTLGFTAPFFIDLPDSTHLIQKYPYQSIVAPKAGVWSHYKIPFTYCSDTITTIMYLKFKNKPEDITASILFDNLSLKQLKDTFGVLTVKISDSSLGECGRRLYSNVRDMGCPMSYRWKMIGDTTIYTTSSIDVTSTGKSTYTLTIYDGCGRSATDTFKITPCPCSIGEVFGASKDSVLPSTITTSLASGYYHIKSNMTVTGSVTFTNARILVDSGVTVTVGNTAKLTLDNCHLLTCPTAHYLWNGIVLATTGSGTGGTSGQIEVKNNSLIEDAVTAINANYIKAPSSGDIIKCTNSIFNRNIIDINIANGYTVSSAITYPITITGNIFTARKLDTAVGYPNTWPNATTLKSTVTASDAKPSFVISKNYKKQLCKNGTFSNLGVQLQNIGITFGGGSSYAESIIGGGTTTNDVNVFDNLGYGLHSYNSNTEVRNALFINISKTIEPDSAGGIYGGIGIVAQCDKLHTANKFKMTVATGGGNSANMFHDC